MSTTSISTPLATSSEQPRPKQSHVWLWILVGAGAWVVGFIALGFVATLVIPNVLHRFSLATQRKVEVDFAAIHNALTEFAVNNGGQYPDNLEVLVTPDVNGAAYLDSRRVPLDPWGREYLYERPGPRMPKPRVFTYGKDGKPGGIWADTDIDSSRLMER